MNPNWAGKIERRVSDLEGQLVAESGAARERLTELEKRIASLTPEGFDALRADVLTELRHELEEMRAYVRRATGRKR